MNFKKIVFILIIPVITSNLYSQNNTTQQIDLLHGVSISGDWFIAYSNTKKGNENWDNKFIVKRSYFTIKKEINDVFSVRYTQDIAIDKEGSDAGNVETRMKYLYLKVKPKWNNSITDSYFEIGMVHRPWITYEQKINVYRVQGNMAIERNKLYNSAGFGILFGGNIGPKIEKEYLTNNSSSMKGKYASFAIGVFNGGGYASFEENSNKVFEGVLHLRPFANSIPQIQLSHAFNIGKGNTEDAPEFSQFLFHGGYIGKYFNFGGQYHFGKGDYKGTYIEILDPTKALKNDGYSIFSEYIVKDSPFAFFGRYDYFNVTDDSSKNVKRQIAGIKYNLYKGISVVLTGENAIYETTEDLTVDLNLQISF